jgi:hypothetical protein
MSEKIYVHYGTTKFNKEQFKPIETSPFFPKPRGGFWASAKDAKFGWREWSRKANYKETRDDNKIEFKLSPEARVLTLESTQDIADAVKRYPTELPKEIQAHDMAGISRMILCPLDFNAISRDYDAIEVIVSNWNGVSQMLPMWDCDSIVVMNPDIVMPIEEKKIEINKPVADTILEDIVITPQAPTYKQDFYQIVEDILEEDEHGQLSFMSYFDSEEKGR